MSRSLKVKHKDCDTSAVVTNCVNLSLHKLIYMKRPIKRTVRHMDTNISVFAAWEPVKLLISYSNELFLFQRTNKLCTCITKIVIIFLNKAAFSYKKRTSVNIFCYNDQPGTILKLSLYAFATVNDVIILECISIIVQTRQFSAIHFVCLRERTLIL